MRDKTVRIISSSEKTPSRCGNVLATILLKNEIRTKQVICKIYKTLLKHSGSTTNMKTHLSRHHPTHSTTTNTAKRNESTYHSQNLIKTTVESNRKKTSQQTLEDCIKKQEKYPINRPRAINIAKQNEFFSVKINTRCQQWSVQGLETLCQQPRGIVSGRIYGLGHGYGKYQPILDVKSYYF